MPKYKITTGIWNIKDRGVAEVTKELTELHVLETFSGLDVTKLTKKQRAEAMESLLLLNESSNGHIKGCACEDGRKKRKTIKMSKRLQLQLPLSKCL